jgi:hypothetical protein
VIAFINNILDGYFPFFKTHRVFLLGCGIALCDFNRDVSVIEADRIAKLLCWHKLSRDVCKAQFPFSLGRDKAPFLYASQSSVPTSPPYCENTAFTCGVNTTTNV